MSRRPQHALPRRLEALRRRGATDVVVFGGGIIPDADGERLRAARGKGGLHARDAPQGHHRVGPREREAAGQLRGRSSPSIPTHILPPQNRALPSPALASFRRGRTLKRVSSAPLSIRFTVPVHLVLMERIASLLDRSPFEPAWEETLKAALGSGYRAPNRAQDPFGENGEALDQRLGSALGVAAAALSEGTQGTPSEMAAYQAAGIVNLWNEFGARLQRIIDAKAVDVPLLRRLTWRATAPSSATPGSACPSRGTSSPSSTRRGAPGTSPRPRIRGRSPSAAAARASIWQASMGSRRLRLRRRPLPPHGRDPRAHHRGDGHGQGARRPVRRVVALHPLRPRRAPLRSRRTTADFHVAEPVRGVPPICWSRRSSVTSAGRFTGAVADVPGFFALPKAGGSLFLDEVGEIPEHVQVKLLRPLQNREYVPLGETRPHPLLGRLLFATHRDLEALCREGKIRRDLYERINGDARPHALAPADPRRGAAGSCAATCTGSWPTGSPTRYGPRCGPRRSSMRSTPPDPCTPGPATCES